MLTSGSSHRLVFASLTLFLLLSATAHADQCQVVSKAVADKAVYILTTTTTYVPFCEPCGDAKPTNTSPVQAPKKQSVSVVKVKGGFTVQIDARDIDLAYVYVDGRPEKNLGTAFRNLGNAAGCTTKGVADPIRIEKLAAGGIQIVDKDPLTDLSLLAGTWTVATATELSTCSTDPSGSKAAYVWTVTAANGQIKIKSSSGAEFVGQVDTTSRSLVAWPVSARSGVMTQLMVQDAKTLTGRQVYAQATKNAADPMCAVYRTITATKAN